MTIEECEKRNKAVVHIASYKSIIRFSNSYSFNKNE